MKQSESGSASTSTSSRRQRKSPEPFPREVVRGNEKILWSEWWPFTRATGAALKQLNRPQKKEYYPLDAEEALI